MKTKFNLCIVNDSGEVLFKKPLNVSWQMDSEKDKKLLSDELIRQELSIIISNQIKIDLDKGIVLKMIEDTLRKE